MRPRGEREAQAAIPLGCATMGAGDSSFDPPHNQVASGEQGVVFGTAESQPQTARQCTGLAVNMRPGGVCGRALAVSVFKVRHNERR